MYHELTVRTPSAELTAFLQSGFYNYSEACGVSVGMHDHNYSEVHILLDGRATVKADGEAFELSDGEILLLPPRVMHCTVAQDRAVRHTAFQISYDTNLAVKSRVDRRLLELLFDAIDEARAGGEYDRLSSLIAAVCCEFVRGGTNIFRSVSDPAFLIQEFFSIGYCDVRLSDLAAQLHVSERQAERLVRRYTGMSFGEKLTETRLGVADRLMQNGDMSLSEIAEYVGYRSYAGFWKAMKRRADRMRDR